MNIEEAKKYLSSFTKAGAPVKDLSRFSGLMAELGDPQDKLKTIHIAGTNGKGSVCEYISLALTAAGFKTGKFTSPYVNFVEERIQIDGEPISPEKLAFYIAKVSEKVRREDYSQFEILCAAAFLYYYDEKCGYVVLETGIGGDLDCTNIVDPVLSVITTVDLDHAAILGNTPADVARHKAGIIKPGRPAVIAPFQRGEVLAVMRERAESTRSPLVTPKNEDLELISVSLDGTEFYYKNKKFRTKMCGKHQMINAAAAIEALRLMKIPESRIEYALENAAVPARMERRENGWVVDGAHNVSGAEAAAELFSALPGRKTLVTGMLDTKDWKGALSILLPIFDSAVAVDLFAPNAVPAENIKGLSESLGVPCGTANSPEEAARLAESSGAELKAVCGSLYLCGKMLGIL